MSEATGVQRWDLNVFHRMSEIEDGDYVLFTAYQQLREENERLKAALIRLRDCDWVITLPDRMDAVRDIAREALTAKAASKPTQHEILDQLAQAEMADGLYKIPCGCVPPAACDRCGGAAKAVCE